MEPIGHRERVFVTEANENTARLSRKYGRDVIESQRYTTTTTSRDGVSYSCQGHSEQNNNLFRDLVDI